MNYKFSIDFIVMETLHDFFLNFLR